MKVKNAILIAPITFPHCARRTTKFLPNCFAIKLGALSHCQQMIRDVRIVVAVIRNQQLKKPNNNNNNKYRAGTTD